MASTPPPHHAPLPGAPMHFRTPEADAPSSPSTRPQLEISPNGKVNGHKVMCYCELRFGDDWPFIKFLHLHILFHDLRMIIFTFNITIAVITKFHFISFHFTSLTCFYSKRNSNLSFPNVCILFSSIVIWFYCLHCVDVV